ncbi:MAG: TlpA disulfide reductase family protein [Gammaproteobacteria bacterium]|nr:TlpA disulfide reductase family protein [Gammaproteobacteria bacterium]
MPKKLISLSIIILLLLTVVIGISQLNKEQLDDNLVFQRIDGTKQTFQQLKGKPLLVTFWSPSCAICLKEVDEFNQLYRSHAGGSEFELLALSMYYDRPDWVIETSRESGMQYPVYFDLQKQLSSAFGDVRATPTSFLLDRDGRIVYRHSGRLDFSLLEQKLTDLIG